MGPDTYYTEKESLGRGDPPWLVEFNRQIEENDAFIRLHQRDLKKKKQKQKQKQKSKPKPKLKPKKTPKSKAHMYPPTKKKKTNKVLKDMGLKEEDYWRKMFGKKNKGKNG